MKRRTAVLWLLALVLLFGGCTRDKEPVRKEIFSMDTHITITCYGKEAKEAADAAAAEIERLNHLWSIGFEDSEVSRINRGETKDLSAETEEILATALSLYQETEGALDITILPLMELWGFTTRTPAVPDPKDLDSALQNVGADRIILKDHKLELETGQGIDLGAGGRAAELRHRRRHSFTGRQHPVRRCKASPGAGRPVAGRDPQTGRWSRVSGGAGADQQGGDHIRRI